VEKWLEDKCKTLKNKEETMLIEFNLLSEEGCYRLKELNLGLQARVAVLWQDWYHLI
jgi:hypothetical protein